MICSKIRSFSLDNFVSRTYFFLLHQKEVVNEIPLIRFYFKKWGKRRVVLLANRENFGGGKVGEKWGKGRMN